MLASAEASRDTAMAKVDELEGELRRAKSRAVDASQPYTTHTFICVELIHW